MDKILVIDMQNIYSKGSPWECEHFESVEDNIVRLIDSVDKSSVFVTEFIAPENPVGTWKKYNNCNSDVNEDVYLNELTDKIKAHTKGTHLISKSTYSSFYGIEKEDRLILSGVVAECCVLATLLDAIGKCKEIIYLRDCIAGQISEKCMLSVIDLLNATSVKVMTLDEYLSGVEVECNAHDEPFDCDMLNDVCAVTVHNVSDFRNTISMVFKAIDKGLNVVVTINSQTDVKLVRVLQGLTYAQIDFRFDIKSLRTMFPRCIASKCSDKELINLYLGGLI